MTSNPRSFLVAVAVCAACIALPAVANTLVDQGAPGNYGAWNVKVASGGASQLVNAAAQTSGATTEVLVTNSAGGSAVPATPLANRRAIEIFNNGPNAIYCTVDGTAPVVNKARPIAANGGSWSLDVSSAISIKCIAATAAQLTTAATIVTEVS